LAGLNAIHAGHHDIQHHQVGTLLLDQLQGLSTTVGDNHLMVPAPKGTLYCPSNVSVIIND